MATVDLTSPCAYTASHALAEIRQGNLTVEEYAMSLLSRIKDRDPTVKAWTYLNPDQVLNEARQLDSVPIEKRGPLHGLPVGIKDVMLTKGTGLGQWGNCSEPHPPDWFDAGD